MLQTTGGLDNNFDEFTRQSQSYKLQPEHQQNKQT